MIRTVLCFMATLGIWLNPAAVLAAASMSEADILAERLLWAVGSRPVWASLTNTVFYSQQYRRDDPTDVGAVITIDYLQPRLRIDTTGRDVQRVRLIDGDGDRIWHFDRQGRPEKAREDELAQDLRRYTAHVYWTLQRIAVRDPKLRLEIGRNGRLEVYEANTRIAWYQLDARGEPYAMGAHDDNVGVICGPWDVEQRGIRYPAWVSRPDGSWRAALKSLAVNVQMDEKLFTQPLVSDQ
ncbi:MAG TPA: hypothetical protein VGD45_33860 [Steroidobacter sp.]|uniref:hypothetical protein n=1 Tax=Steroidobacter sp. TaxID=1978227 RepID=UPI002ED8757F